MSNERKLPGTAKADSRHDPIAAAPGYATRRDFTRLEAHIATFHILEIYLIILFYRFCSLSVCDGIWPQAGMYSTLGFFEEATDSHDLQSRSGRIFSPYGPWGSSVSPSDAPLPSSPGNLDVLQVDVPIAPLVQAAALADLRREADGIGDGEGPEIQPPPSPLCDPLSSPLSTPPSSPESVPVCLPSDVASNSIAQPLGGVTMVYLQQQIDSRTLKRRAGKKKRQARQRREQEPNPHWTRIPTSLSLTWSQPQKIQLGSLVPLDGGTERGFTAKRPSLCPRDRAAPWTLPELKDRGFRLIEWDGKWVLLWLASSPAC